MTNEILLLLSKIVANINTETNKIPIIDLSISLVTNNEFEISVDGRFIKIKAEGTISMEEIKVKMDNYLKAKENPDDYFVVFLNNGTTQIVSADRLTDYYSYNFKEIKKFSEFI